MKYLILSLLLSGCSVLNPNVTNVLEKFCAFHRSELAQVLLTPEQQHAGFIVCNAVGVPFGSPD